MIVDIVMPRLSDTMTEGYVADWHKAVGDSIAVGESLVDIEYDKATVSYQVERAGVVRELLANIDDCVPVGQALARIEVAG